MAASVADGREAGMADWMKPFARTIDVAKKYVVSSTLGPGRLERGACARGSGASH